MALIDHVTEARVMVVAVLSSLLTCITGFLLLTGVVSTQGLLGGDLDTNIGMGIACQVFPLLMWIVTVIVFLKVE